MVVDMTTEHDGDNELTHSDIWIRLELIPLPALEERYSSLLLWWNPDQRLLLGEGHEQILKLVDQAMQDKALRGSQLNHFEITDPLNKPSELAAILAQHFWVIPEPVAEAGVEETETPRDDSLQ